MDKHGFTIIETLIVLFVMAIFSTITVYGIRNLNNRQAVVDAQKSFMADLRATQNKVLNGADGVNFKNVTINSPDESSYVVDGNTLKLPKGTFFSNPTTTICFFNPKSSIFNCGACTNKFTCPLSGNSLTVSFTDGTTIKNVVVEGSGITINRIYAN